MRASRSASRPSVPCTPRSRISTVRTSSGASSRTGKRRRPHTSTARSPTATTTWVYDLEGRPAGFVVLKMDDHGIADIDLLAVDPAQQGQGIAQMLNRFAFERSQEESMSYVVVATADDPGHTPPRRSYESAGFVPMPIQWNLQIIRL